jgi:putative ABC transport system permease protein
MLPWIPLSAVALSLAAAALAVLGGLLRVVRLPPAAAMRPPAPPSFGPTLGERIGLARLYSPSVRMVVRDIERRPLRALLTTFGIASAVGVMIAGTWWRDSVDYLLEVEIRMRDRQDVSVALTEPVSSAALYDFVHMRGVLRAEATRDAPVRLSHGTRSYRTSLSGLDADSQMRPQLDERLRRAQLPASGIVLNNRLAQRLGLALGDTVHLEILQGARAQADLSVTGFSFELTQLLASMNRDALNRLLGEGQAMSGARLLIDASQREAVLRQLKNMPRVAAAAEIGPVIRFVRENNARNVLFFSSVLAVLGAAIALGVVYNNARIALAERAWDLASLRVLGATRGEVSGLLLGELGAELLLALPLGCLMGYGLAWSILALSAVTEMHLPLVVEPRTYAFACLVVLTAGVVSAMIVRRRVDQLDLVGVLKTRE